MKIKNINGISQTICRCGSWLKHWEKSSGQTTEFCLATGCLKKDIAGAHIQKASSPDQKWYIYPLCKSHNQSISELKISDNYILVSANKKETCEKP